MLLIFLIIPAISSVIYYHTTNSAYAQTMSLPSPSQEVTPFKKWYNEHQEKQQPSNTVGVKITSPATGQKVPVGELKASGTSTDNATTDCQVYVDVNDIKPMQNTTAAGVGGQNDYSNWTFTYTSKYHTISEGINELTAKLSCITNPANITKYYSVNVTGVTTSLAAIDNTTAPSSNATTKNETQHTTTMTTMENNETQVSAATANQTQQQILPIQQESKPGLQTELSTSSVQQLLNQTQNREEQEEQVVEEEEQQQEQEEEQKQPMIDSQEEGSFTSEESVPLDESSTGSDIIAEEPKGTTGEKKLAELIESVTSEDAYDEEQVEQEEPLEDELRQLERQEVPLETIERQPLEQKQPLETLEDHQPIEEQPMQTFNKEEQPSQLGIQPLEQQPLEEQQPLQTFDRQQLSPSQQLITEQQVPESPAGKQQEEEKSSINHVQEHHGNEDNMPFVLPFDSHDIISAN